MQTIVRCLRERFWSLKDSIVALLLCVKFDQAAQKQPTGDRSLEVNAARNSAAEQNGSIVLPVFVRQFRVKEDSASATNQPLGTFMNGIHEWNENFRAANSCLFSTRGMGGAKAASRSLLVHTCANSNTLAATRSDSALSHLPTVRC